MKHIIEGFLKLQREAFPQRSELFKRPATSQKPRTLFIACSKESTPLSEFVRSPPSEKRAIYERAARAPGLGCDEACLYYGTPHAVCIRVRFP